MDSEGGVAVGNLSCDSAATRMQRSTMVPPRFRMAKFDAGREFYARPEQGGVSG